ncbi:MAG: hypothetical protein R6U52_05795 [Kosmotogaceae bacterium]
MKWIGFFILVLMTLLLFGFTLFSAFDYDIYIVPVLFFIVACFLIGSIKVFRETRRLEAKVRIFLGTIFAVALGTLSTYFISVYFDLGAIIAAALVGIIAAMTITDYAVEIYCGAFVGMVSPEVLDDFTHIIIAGFVAGIIFYLSRGSFKGYGGKLGTIAFSSWIIMILISKCELVDELTEIRHFGMIVVLYSIGAAVITYILSIRLRNGPVLASGLISLAGALMLPAIYNENAATLSAVVMAASFVGMSSKKRLKNELEVLLSGVIMGILFVYSVNHFCGAGGKLGTLAFASVVSTNGLLFLIRKIKKKQLQ